MKKSMGERKKEKQIKLIRNGKVKRLREEPLEQEGKRSLQRLTKAKKNRGAQV